MLEITVNIKAPELAQAILALAGAFGTHAATTEVATTAPSGQATDHQTAPEETEKPKRQRRATQQDVPEQSTHQDDSTPKSDETPHVDVPTVVELRAKAQAVGTTPEAKKAIKALLDQFGAKSISDAPEEKRADFLAELDLV